MCDMNPVGVVGAAAGATAGTAAGLPGMVAGGIAGGWGGNRLGDAIGLGNSPAYQFQNPGTIDIASDNPEMSQEIDLARSQRSDFDSWASQFTNPDRYKQMGDLYSQRASTNAMNHAAQMGMGGSSVGMGMANEAAFNTDQAMINRQLQDHLQIAQMNSVLNGQITGDIFNTQNQFSNFQNAQASAYQNAQAQNTQMIGNIMSLGGTVAGAYFGGPMGAMAGSQAGKLTSSGSQAQPVDYSSFNQPMYPTYGQSAPGYGGGGGYGLGADYSGMGYY